MNEELLISTIPTFRLYLSVAAYLEYYYISHPYP